MHFQRLRPLLAQSTRLTLSLSPNEFEDHTDQIGIFETEPIQTEYLTIQTEEQTK